MKLKVTTEQIRMFSLNASNEVRILSIKGLRSLYTSKLQITLDQLEVHDKSIMKKVNFFNEKFAKLDDRNCFVYEGEGDNKSLAYEPDKKKLRDDELEKFWETMKEIDIEPYLLDEKDIPKNADGTPRISNALAKIFYPFVLTKELRDSLVYGELKPIEQEPAKTTKKESTK